LTEDVLVHFVHFVHLADEDIQT